MELLKGNYAHFDKEEEFMEWKRQHLWFCYVDFDAFDTVHRGSLKPWYINHHLTSLVADHLSEQDIYCSSSSECM